jgi:hypothetical protein
MFTSYSPDLDLSQAGPLVVRGMPASIYHGLDRLNASTVHPFSQGMMQGIVAATTETDQTMPMALGTAIHSRVLEPKDFESRVLEREDIGPGAKVGYRKACEDNPDAIVLAKGWRADIDGVREGIRRSPFSERLMFGYSTAEKELTILWTETVGGQSIPCKARLDFFEPTLRVVADLKTANSVVPGVFEKTIGERGYHIKGAWYCRAVSVAELCVNPRMVWVACETSPPYTCQPFEGSGRLMEQGWAEACVGVHRYAAWQACGREESAADPVPPPTLLTVDIPGYMQLDPEILSEFLIS